MLKLKTGRIESIQFKNEIFSVPYCNQVREGKVKEEKQCCVEKEEHEWMEREMRRKAILRAGRERTARKGDQQEGRENERVYLIGEYKAFGHILLV